MTAHRSSLRQRHPTLWIVPATLGLTTLLFIPALALPLMHTSQQLLWKRWESSYSAWRGVLELWQQGDQVLAVVLLVFCIIFPMVKLIALARIWFVAMPDAERKTLLHWLEVLGRWSMLDVFVVAILIVLVKLGPLTQVEPRAGVYVFAGAILLSMVLTMAIDRLARR